MARRSPAAALVAVLAFAAPAFPQDPPPKGGGKTPPAAPAETPASVAMAEELGKKLSAKNKLDVLAAIEALGRMHTPTSNRVLMDFIRSTPNSEHGSAAVRALGSAGNAAVVDFLCGKDGARSGRLLVAEAGCQALAKVGDKRAIPTLLELMKDGKAVVISAAVEAVVQLDPAAEGLVDRLAVLSTANDDRVRRSVATALGNLRSPRAVGVLVAMATKDGNSLVRLNACRSLGRLAPFEARKALEGVAASDKSQEVRAEAQEALLRIPAEPPPEKGGAAPGGTTK